MKFILPQTGRHGNHRAKAACTVAFNGVNYVIQICPAEMGRMGWKLGDKVAVGYDAERHVFGLQPHESGFALTSTAKRSRTCRVQFRQNTARLIDVPDAPKTGSTTAMVLSRDNGVLVLRNPLAQAAPNAAFVTRNWNAATAV
jgi:hypothetical protein